MKPRLFVASSRESLEVAYAIQENLERDAEVTVWTQGVFELSSTSVDDVLRQLENSDFAVLILTPDDLLRLRGEEVSAARDNVILELGLAIGRLGRKRFFMVSPRTSDLHIPTDLLALAPATYDPNRSDRNTAAALGPACNQIRRAIERHGRIGTTRLEAPSNLDDLISRAVGRVAGVVAQSFGPHGGTVAYTTDLGTDVVARRGLAVVRAVRATDPVEQKGISKLRQVAEEIQSTVGDGTKTAVLVAASLFRRGHEAVAAGHSRTDVLRGISKAAEVAAQFLQGSILGPVSPAQVLQAAATAAQRTDIGSIAVRAIEEAGPDGVVTIEDGHTGELMIESTEGLQFDRGFVSNKFINDPARGRCVLEDCYLLLSRQSLESMRDVLRLFETVAQTGHPFAVICDRFGDEVLATMILNNNRGNLRCVAVAAPGVHERRADLMEDLAVFTGSTVIDPSLGLTIERATLQDLGRARSITVETDTTVLLEGAGSEDLVRARADVIRNQISRVSTDFDREKLQERLARLVGRVVTIRVGGQTGPDQADSRARAESALRAGLAASRAGLLPGGGVALFRAGRHVETLRAGSPGERAGMEACVFAMEQPLRRIVASAGRDESDVVGQIRDAPLTHGFNTEDGHVGDMIQAGVVDPASIVLRALGVAVAHAKAMLEVQSWEVIPDERSESTGQEAARP